MRRKTLKVFIGGRFYHSPSLHLVESGFLPSSPHQNRLRKGKALSQDYLDESIPPFRSIPEEKLRRPLTIQPVPHPDKKPTALNIRSPDHPEARPDPSAVLIPPPPAKHAERERFFREKSMDGLPGHLRGPSSNSSSTCSGSTDYGDLGER
jgi:hypothetical protein